MTCAEWGWLCWIEGHPGLASWLQAAGSVLALFAAFAVPVLVERRSRAAARNTDALTTINALAMAAGAADAFCTGLQEHGGNEGFLDAFPQVAFSHAEEALAGAIPAAHRLEINVLPVVTARLRLQAFVGRTRIVDQVREAGNLEAYIEFMRTDAEGLKAFHDDVRALLVPAKKAEILTGARALIRRLKNPSGQPVPAPEQV